MMKSFKHVTQSTTVVRELVNGLATIFGSHYGGRNMKQKIGLLRKSSRQKKFGYPKELSFEIVSKCILDCEFCILKDLETWKFRRKVSMTFEQFKKIVNDVSSFATFISFSGGEPLINKDIFKMFSYARSNNIYTQLNTNALLLSERNNMDDIINNPPDKILLSYEALNKETYENIRRKGNYDKLLGNIKQLIEKKKETGNTYPIIVLQMVLTKKNSHMKEYYFEAAKRLGADYASIKALGVWPEGDPKYDKKMVEEHIIPRSQDPISRHEIDDEGNIIFLRTPGECPAVERVYIGSGGEVIPCDYIIAKTEIMGNAVDNNFLDIWNSKKYRDYRHQMINNWANPMCHRCIGIGATAIRKKL